MKKKRQYRYLFIVCISLILMHFATSAVAQGGFTWHGKLDTIKKDGFYLIDLPPDLLSKCRVDLADLRILASNDQFVSYVLKDSRKAADMAKTYMAIPGAHMVQKDSSRHTYISVEYPEPYDIDYVAFLIREPVYFKRNLTIEAQGANPTEWTIILDADLDPAKKMFAVPTVKTRRLRIDIDNADNAPLVVSEVFCLQASRYLLAWLQSGMTYQVLAGNPQAAAPDYDLKYFTDSLKEKPMELRIDTLQRLSGRDQPAPARAMAGTREIADQKDRSSLLLWGCLFAVLLFLVYFSVRMAKAIAKKDTHDRL